MRVTVAYCSSTQHNESARTRTSEPLRQNFSALPENCLCSKRDEDLSNSEIFFLDILFTSGEIMQKLI